MEFQENEKIRLVLMILTSLIIVGTIGYAYFLDVSILDALYMTVITISTVGYTEVGEMNDQAKIFSMLIIFIGLGTVGYGFTKVVSLFMEGTFRDTWRRKKNGS